MIKGPLTFFKDDISLNDFAQLNDSWFFSDILPLNVQTKDVYNTKEIDAYRQGVELTRQRQYDAGVVKIHAGEPGHILRKNRFGMDAFSRSKDNEFLDNDKFTTLDYLRSQGDLTYPISLDGEIESESGKYDGVLEPLTIRPILDRSTIDAPFEMHTIKSHLMGGPEDMWGSSVQILNVDYFDTDTNVIHYNDMGYFSSYQIQFKPFNDTYVNPLDKTDSYISPKKISATSGWNYDGNTACGTDSITHGGLKYFNDNLKQILPFREVKSIDLNATYPLQKRTGIIDGYDTSGVAFNDNKTLIYNEQDNLNYPVMLNDESLDLRNKSLLKSLQKIKGKITKFSTEQFLSEENKQTIAPFVDHNKPEQSNFSSYYMTGSPVEKFGFSLSSPLRSKTQIKLELPIDSSLQMFATSSAIYYYNKTTKTFALPHDAENDIDDAKLALGLGTSYAGLYRPEDTRGFGPIGNQVSSGSSTKERDYGWASDEDFEFDLANINSKSWSTTNRIKFLSKNYSKSISNNLDYSSDENEIITLPINQPFLLEKAIFEIPIKAGPGWLNDKTISSTPIGYINVLGLEIFPGVLERSNDFSGPALTVSLFNQINSGSQSFKDLILTGTIIPAGDNIKNIHYKQTHTNLYGSEYGDEDLYPLSIFEPEGFLSYGTSPSAIITSNDGYYTGSVSLLTEAAVSNGPLLSWEGFSKDYSSTNPVSNEDRINFAKDLLSSKWIDLSRKFSSSDKNFQQSSLKTIDVFGRNSKGAEQSGRSIFGNEFIVPESQDNFIPNPLFLASSYEDFPQTFKDILDPVLNPDFRFYTQFVVPITKTTPSPYLLKPGDKLTLAISKMRPALASNGLDPVTGVNNLDIFRNGLEHDICIDTGSIKITLYGSLLKNGHEFHDTSNQPLNSNIIHETIGADDYCLDQYDIEYSHSLYGSYIDDYITGSLVSKGPNNSIVTGNRGRVFSKLKSNEQSPPASTGAEAAINPSKAFRLQPWSERVGNNRNIRLINYDEKIYDSMLPDFLECMKADATQIHWLEAPENFLGIGKYDPYKSYGILAFDYRFASTQFINNKWTSSFPYSKDYSSISRMEKQFNFIKTNKIYSSLSTSIDSSEEMKVDELILQRVFFACDTNIITNYTGSASNDDLTKILFGFGDEVFSTPTGLVLSKNNPSFRDNEGVIGYGPIIRGWKYGIYNGLPSYSSNVFRRDRFGQVRDMLEQSIDTAFYIKNPISPIPGLNRFRGTVTPPIEVKFFNAQGETTKAELTMSSNINMFATSSIPYVDRDKEPFVDNTNYNFSVVPLLPF
jgi:hypothetical protein